MDSRSLARPLLCVACLIVILSAALPSPTYARPNYKKAFDKLHKDIATKKTSCYVCHSEVRDDKKHLNHYGQALAEELGERNVKDEEKVIAALKAIEEKGECRSGKWKLRLERGLPPCVCGRFDHEADSYIARQLGRDRRDDQ